MADRSAIEWTDATWNPIRARNLTTGQVGWHCEHATTGCEFCYAEGFNLRLGTRLPFKPGHRKDVEIFLDEEMLTQPLRWKKPRMIFVCSMTDLFAEFVTDEMIDRMLAVMALAPQHTFQVLTKRPGRMRDYFAALTDERQELAQDALRLTDRLAHEVVKVARAMPLPNVWLGVSAERQQEADERIPLLLQTPAAVRFISAEPLLGRVDLVSPLYTGEAGITMRGYLRDHAEPDDFRHHASKLDWVIAGGESGPKARPMHAEWAGGLQVQCAVAKTAFFFKQWGEWLPWSQFGDAGITDDPEQTRFITKEWVKDHWSDLGHPVWFDVTDGNVDDDQCVGRVGKAKAGRLLDGVEHNGMPERP